MYRESETVSNGALRKRNLHVSAYEQLNNEPVVRNANTRETVAIVITRQQKTAWDNVGTIKLNLNICNLQEKRDNETLLHIPATLTGMGNIGFTYEPVLGSKKTQIQWVAGFLLLG
jgi:hypothetical protein